MLIINDVEKSSVCFELDVKKGDKLVAFDGYPAEDLLDYLYYEAKENFVMTIERDGEIIDCEVEKYEDEELGLSFVDDNLGLKTCRNNCVFCFVAQLPKGMRDSLYVKDDDYRQSFLCGNYVTLTNVSDAELDRIIRLGLSPIYISVHTLKDGQREMMLNNRFAGKLLDQMQKLSDGGIAMHAQIVLVKNMNDGEILYDTCMKLAAIKNVKSLAVVPCGLTGHREGLTKIDDIDGEYSKGVIELTRKVNSKVGRTFVFASDDFYIRAKEPFESYDHYGAFEQIENGVGMFSAFIEDYNQTCRKSTYRKTFLLVTGVAAHDFIREYATRTEQLCKGLKVHVISPENEFFGKSITATGLLTGQDVLKAVENFNEDFDELILPKCMMKETEYVFLDGLTVEELERKIKKPVRVVDVDGESFFNALTGNG